MTAYSFPLCSGRARPRRAAGDRRLWRRRRGSGLDADPQEVLDATFNNDETDHQRRHRHQRRRLGRGPGQLRRQPQRPVPGRPGRSGGAAAARPDRDASTGEGAGQSVNFDGGLTSPTTTASSSTAASTYEVGTDTFDQLKQSVEAPAAQAEDVHGRATPPAGLPAGLRAGDRGPGRRRRPPATSTSAPGSRTSPTTAPRTSTAPTSSTSAATSTSLRCSRTSTGLAQSIPNAAGPDRRGPARPGLEAIRTPASTSTAARTTTSCASWTSTSRSIRQRSRARRRSRSTASTSASPSASARSTRTRRSTPRPTPSRSRTCSASSASAASARSAAGSEGLDGGRHRASAAARAAARGGGSPTAAPATPTSTASAAGNDPEEAAQACLDEL